MKNFFKKHEKFARVLILIAIFALISIISAQILYYCNFIKFDEAGDLAVNKELFDSFKNTWYGYLIVVLAEVLVTSLLSFVPAISMAFIILVKSLYPNPVVAFIVSFSGVLFTSAMLYILGRFGGYALGKKIIGEEDCEKASKLLNNKGLIYFPMMMMFPIFPDDALVMVAGTLKMSLKWFIPSIIIGRGIGVVTIVFGLSMFDFASFAWWQWVLFILGCALLICAVFFAATKFNKYIEKKNKKAETESEAKPEKVEV